MDRKDNMQKNYAKQVHKCHQTSATSKLGIINEVRIWIRSLLIKVIGPPVLTAVQF